MSCPTIGDDFGRGWSVAGVTGWEWKLASISRCCSWLKTSQLASMVSTLPDQSERDGRTTAIHFSLSGGGRGATYNQFSGVAKALKKKGCRKQEVQANPPFLSQF